MKISNRLGWALGLMLIVLVGRVWGEGPAAYKSPELTTDIFQGELTVGKGELKKTATALAGFVRNGLPLSTKSDYQTAARLLGVALRLDPENREALIADGELSNGMAPKHNAAWSKDAALKQIHSIAEAAKSAKGKGDPMLAAYLYSAAALAAPNDEDTYQAQLLKKSGHVVDWKWADAAVAAVVETPKVAAGPTRLSKINGLVVMREADGNYHGKAIEIIAAPRTAGGGPVVPIPMPASAQQRALGVMGPEMRVALNEAFRLAELRHAGAEQAGLEISFGDKYSSKDGGSAGTAFTLLILSSLGDFDLATEAAVTGDITVDGTVRPVGAVAAKVHGAALDRCKRVAIPQVNVNQIEDAILLQGPSALWEIQIFSIEKLDDAIAVMRKDPNEKLAQAIQLFDELKKDFSTKQPGALALVPGAKEKLAKVLELAPNHVSAKYLLQLSQGKKPAHLSLVTSLDESFNALGLMRDGLTGTTVKAENATAVTVDAAQQSLGKIQRMADPSALPVIAALHEYCQAYLEWGNGVREGDKVKARTLIGPIRAKRDAVVAGISKLITDKNVIDQLMH